MEMKEDLCSLECPSLLSIDDKSQQYVTGLPTVSEVSVSSDVTAITEEGVSFVNSLPEDENAFQPLKKLNDMQIHVRQFDNDIKAFSKYLCKKIEDVDKIALESENKIKRLTDEALIAKSLIEALTEDVKVKEDELKSTRFDLTTTNDEVAGLKTKNEQLKSKNEELKENILKLERDMYELEETNNTLTNENISMNKQFENPSDTDLEKVMDEVLERNKTLTTKITCLKKKMENYSHIDNNADEMKNKLKDFENENATLMKNVRDLQNIEAENAQLKKNLADQNNLMHDLKTSMHEFGVHQDHAMLTIEINSKTTNVYEANQQLRDAIEKKKVSIVGMKEELRLLKRKEMDSARPCEENVEKTNDINNKIEEFDRLDQINKELTDEFKQLKLLEIELKLDLNNPTSKNSPDQ